MGVGLLFVICTNWVENFFFLNCSSWTQIFLNFLYFIFGLQGKYNFFFAVLMGWHFGVVSLFVSLLATLTSETFSLFPYLPFEDSQGTLESLPSVANPTS